MNLIQEILFNLTNSPEIWAILVCMVALGTVVRKLYKRLTRAKIDPLERHISMLISQYRQTTPDMEQSIPSLQRFLTHHNVNISYTQLVAVLIYYQNGYLIER